MYRVIAWVYMAMPLCIARLFPVYQPQSRFGLAVMAECERLAMKDN